MSADKQHKRIGLAAAKGMAWTGFALIVSKLLSFVSQIALGHFLEVETYAVFALISTAMIFATGFQNPGISKVLTQEQDQFDEVFGPYLSFAIVMGLMGLVTMFLTGLVFQLIYETPYLSSVAATHSLSIPMVGLAALLIAVLGIRSRFRDISLIEMKRSLFYYLILIGLAAVGAGPFSIALALVSASALHIFLLRRVLPDLNLQFHLSTQEFFQFCVRMKWVILASFLMTLGQRGDYLVLGNMLTNRELGFYFFGFLLVTNITIMLATGINQTLLPILSKMKSNPVELRQKVLRMSGAIARFSCLICIGLVGLGGTLTHWLWGGKWDGAVVVVLFVAAALPIRMMATMGGVILEANGAWGTRVLTLVFDSITVIAFAGLGARLGGLEGAVYAVASQRILSGIVTYVVARRKIGISWDQFVKLWARCFGPYLLTMIPLLVVAPVSVADLSDIHILSNVLLPTSGALVVYVVANWLINRDLMRAMILILPRRKQI